MNKRSSRWMFFIATMVLTSSFFSYGYKVLASGNQVQKEGKPIVLKAPEDQNVFRILSSGLSGGFLGVELENITADDLLKYGLEKEEGVLIKKVEKGSPAEEAGVQTDDVVLGYAGQPVFSVAQFRRLVSETPTGRKVSLVVVRSKKKVELSAKIGKRGGKRASDLFPDLTDIPDVPGLEFRSRRGWDGPGLSGNRAWSITTAKKPRLGISAIPMTEQLAPKYGVKDGGVLITEVNKDSVADKAGLKAGDVITDIDNVKVTDLEDVTRALDRNEGRSFDIKVIRDQKALTLKAQLPEAEQKERKSGSQVNL